MSLEAGGRAGVNNSSVRNSSYIFQRISTKLSHNYCNQVPQRILSGFFDSIIFHGITALCFFRTYVIYREYFFCAQLLLHFCPPPKRVSGGGHRNTGVRASVRRRPSVTTLWTQLLWDRSTDFIQILWDC